jgi:translation elongation factor EF-G
LLLFFVLDSVSFFITPSSSLSNFLVSKSLLSVIWENEELGAKFKVYPIDEAPIPDDLKAKAREVHNEVVELAVEQDEEALMEYLVSCCCRFSAKYSCYP